MKLLKKLFGEIKMTWLKVIVLSVAAGTYTALMAMLVPETNSFHDIAVFAEGWVLPAMFIIMNCEKPLEAAFKTFVFFLISQPLVYLIQVPFNDMGFGLFGYYRYWFIITLFTFPGAFAAWFVKKDNALSGVILSVALALLATMGVSYAKQAVEHFPNHLLSAVYCFVMIFVFAFGCLENKLPRIISLAVSFATAAVTLAAALSSSLSFSGNIVLEKYEIDENWSVRAEDESISEAAIVTFPDGTSEPMLNVTYHKEGENTLILTDPEGKEHKITVTCDKDKQVTVKEE